VFNTIYITGTNSSLFCHSISDKEKSLVRLTPFESHTEHEKDKRSSLACHNISNKKFDDIDTCSFTVGNYMFFGVTITFNDNNASLRNSKIST
jgi:hypothetical protein